LYIKHRTLYKDYTVENNIINVNFAEGKRINEFLQKRAKLLVGDLIDLDKHPVTFLLSDTKEPNISYEKITEDNFPLTVNRVIVTEVVYEKLNDNPCIVITKGLINLLDNLDQLDFILANKLTEHIIKEKTDIKDKSKAKQAMYDIHAIDLMINAKSNPKEGLEFIKKNEQTDDEEESLLDKVLSSISSSLKDKDRISILEAKLTEVSASIQDIKEVTPLDKDLFNQANYSDELEEYLKKNSFEDCDDFIKLRILINASIDLAKKTN